MMNSWWQTMLVVKLLLWLKIIFVGKITWWCFPSNSTNVYNSWFVSQATPEIWIWWLCWLLYWKEVVWNILNFLIINSYSYSKYNDSLFGWMGHSSNGKHLNVDPEGHLIHGCNTRANSFLKCWFADLALLYL